MAPTVRQEKHQWRKLSFPSTLHLCPVLDLLVEDVPEPWRFEVRLGLQEALVNAVKHGNGLDPGKRVCVHFSARSHRYWWMIADRGGGFKPPCCCHAPPLPPVAMDADLDDVTMDLDAVEDLLPGNEGECGRGLFILHQVFDRVEWQEGGRVLHLYKETDPIRVSKRQRLAQAAQGLRASLRERYVALVR
ncbi:ATP-binding protein [Limnothrix sp. FACHB-708]|uniref:ATP-binding protein n=1 Tax=unclassified Limnothrix TaxID=2632864 RepID=UPI00081EDA42|nr:MULTISPECIES: ATP-binding protein [unclassified Limnothrix]MBD2553849.1 ATP-binding protein [Limnothrix sp. FACHB-708]MBD2590871.1 ATP-binding protein [Limnothrix sp. FACHB-406]OCQ98615.1 hypothetical protein BCR12_03025 [Limnothrix sp. P13C2]